MRRAPHDGQNPRRLQLKASTLSWPHSSQRSLRKPWARMPHSRKAANLVRSCCSRSLLLQGRGCGCNRRPSARPGVAKGNGSLSRRGIARPAQAQRGRWGKPARLAPPGASHLPDARGWPLSRCPAVSPKLKAQPWASVSSRGPAMARRGGDLSGSASPLPPIEVLPARDRHRLARTPGVPTARQGTWSAPADSARTMVDRPRARRNLKNPHV